MEPAFAAGAHQLVAREPAGPALERLVDRHQLVERIEHVPLRRRHRFGALSARHWPGGVGGQAIAAHYQSKGSNTDSRLVRAPSGAGVVDPTGGGFLVQVDFGASIFMLAHDMGEILERVNKVPISANSNGIKIPGVDETSRATGSRWGGVSSTWAAEGTAGSESRPKFRLVEFDLKKLISKMTVTDELLADSTALTAIAAMAFSEEVMFMTEDAIIEGTGAGQPLGILNSPALVEAAEDRSYDGREGRGGQPIIGHDGLPSFWPEPPPSCGYGGCRTGTSHWPDRRARRRPRAQRRGRQTSGVWARPWYT